MSNNHLTPQEQRELLRLLKQAHPARASKKRKAVKGHMTRDQIKLYNWLAIGVVGLAFFGYLLMLGIVRLP